ncbi:MAG: RNA polymerase sigma factor [Acidimicrobiia bacterium]|nr:RNA polymerase sigma factor [Acidimicrobiia bacterium]
MTTRAAPRRLNARLARDLDDAFPTLVEEFADGLYSGVRRLAPGRADAEDLVQETFLRAYRALGSYGPERIRSLKLSPWLWTIALNLCRSAARRRARRVTEVALEAASGTATSPDDTAADAVTASMEAVWRRRLDALSTAQRTAVVLRHVVDLPYADIAEVTGRPVGTTKADVHRGIEQLRRLMADEHTDQE